jgi:hypothetical protein
MNLRIVTLLKLSFDSKTPRQALVVEDEESGLEAQRRG